ncbi:MAG: hypothetical protein F4206_17090, partial [Gammaproteobacteria bacterium]|nr:hypothetical protein [Gammaproteobacteria bacterium]
QTVTVAVGGGTATETADYAAVTGFSIEIGAGAASADGAFEFTPADDELHEGPETVAVTGSAGTVTVTQAALTITDDDGQPSFAVADGSATEGSALTFTVTRAGATANAVSVTWTTKPDTGEGATPAGTDDYTAQTAGQALDFAKGVTEKTFTVATTDDDLDEGDETFLVELSGATGGAAIGTAEATGTITDDDTKGVTVAGGPLSLDEADNPDTALVKEHEAAYTVVLDSEPTDDVTVGVASTDTAIATVSTSRLTFTPADWNDPQTVTVTAVPDAIDNTGDRRAVTVTHTVTAGTSDYGGVTAASVAVTVADDDAAPGGITLTVSPTAVGEAAGKTSVTVTATVDGTTRYATAQTVTVAVGGGTATETADYAAVTGFAITIAAGAASADGTFEFTPADDQLHEGAETVEVTGSAGAVTVTRADLGITDDDTQPSFAVADATATEGGALTFTVTRAGATDDAVAVTWTTKPDGSGTTPATTDDYTAQTAGQVLSFAKGDVTKTFTVATTADDVDEADETFLVALSGATGATITTAEATGTITDDDTKGVTVAGGPVSLAEADNPDTPDEKEHEGAYTVVLDSEPTADVTVGVASGDTAIATVSASSLTFTPANWDEPQTVTVTAVADAIDNSGNSRAVTVTHTVTAGTSDYGSVTAASVAVTVADDDAAPSGITLTVSPTAVGEAAGQTSVTVTATVNGTTRYATAQTVAVSVGGGTATETADYAAVTGFTITVPAGADSADGAFEFTPVDDGLHEGAETVEVTGSAGAVTVTKADLGITDDDGQPAFAVADASATEGGTLTFTVTRAGATDNAVSVTWKTKADADGTNPAGTGDYTAQTAGQQLNFAKGDTAKTFTVATTADDVDEADETFLVALSGATGATITTAEATGTITDDDTKGVTVAGGPVSLAEADNPDTPDEKEHEGSYTVVLDSEPTADVVVNVASGDTGIATVSTSSLTFTPDDWNEPQTVTVTAVDDAIDNSGDSRSATVTHTVTAGTSDYGGVTAASVTVTVTDDDAAPSGITLTVSPTAVGEAAGQTSVTVTATVNGTTRYATAQTVAVAVGGGTATETADYAAVTGFSIEIPAGAASADGTFEFTPVDDDLHEGAESVEVTGSAGSLTVTKADLGITDDDGQPAFAVADASATEGGTLTFTVTRAGATDNAVSVTWKTKADADGTNPAGTGDYTAQTAGQQLNFAKGDTAKTFTVATTADDVDEADETFLVALSGATGATITTAEATGTITDDDTKGVTVAGGPLSLDEADNPDTALVKEHEGAYTVVLDSEPTADVTVGVASGDTAIATVSASSLTFTPANWDEPQTVTVTAVPDAIDNSGNSRAVTVTHTVTAGTSDYGGVTAASVTVTVTDDDAAPSGITLTVSPTAVGEAAGQTSVTVTATVNGTTRYATAQTVAVAVGGGTATETADYAAVTGFSIEIPAGAASADGTFEFTPVDDDLHEGAESVEVTGSAGSLTVTKADLGITDDDGQPAFAVADASATEGGTLTFTVTRAGATDNAVSVTWKTKADADGTNPAGTGDYTAQTAGQQLNFAKGDTAKTFTVATTADDVDEADETFLVALSGATGATITTAEATGTITDDDTKGVTVAGGPLSLDEADNPDTALVKEHEAAYTVVLDSEPTDDVTVGVASTDTAIATVSTSRLTFTPADWNDPQTVTVTAVPDAIDNTGDRRAVTVTHTVTAGTSDYAGVTAASVAVTVADDDAAPNGITLTLSPAAVGEAAGQTSVTVTATVNGTTRYATAQTVAVAVGGGTATETADYAAVTGFSIEIPAGAASADGTFEFTPVDDDLHEGAESVEVTGSAGAVTVTRADLGITDDDGQPAFAVADASATEGGTLTFTVTRAGATDNAVSVTWKTKADADGTNPAGTGDYTAQTAGQQLNFAKGDVTKTFTVATADDDLDEGDETFLVELSGATGGAAITTAEATGTITDDDTKGVTVAGGP